MNEKRMYSNFVLVYRCFLFECREQGVLIESISSEVSFIETRNYSVLDLLLSLCVKFIFSHFLINVDFYIQLKREIIQEVS